MLSAHARDAIISFFVCRCYVLSKHSLPPPPPPAKRNTAMYSSGSFSHLQNSLTPSTETMLLPVYIYCRQQTFLSKQLPARSLAADASVSEWGPERVTHRCCWWSGCNCHPAVCIGRGVTALHGFIRSAQQFGASFTNAPKLVFMGCATTSFTGTCASTTATGCCMAATICISIPGCLNGFWA